MKETSFVSVSVAQQTEESFKPDACNSVGKRERERESARYACGGGGCGGPRERELALVPTRTCKSIHVCLCVCVSVNLHEKVRTYCHGPVLRQAETAGRRLGSGQHQTERPTERLFASAAQPGIVSDGQGRENCNVS